MKTTVLVTGGSGFLSLHIIYQLLNQGFIVRTTVRSDQSFKNVVNTLKRHDTPNIDQLSYVKADLAKDDNWDLAMRDCEYVMSVASPVFFTIPKDENEAIKPATEGILRILKAATKNQVKKVVMTSNFGAVGFSKKRFDGITTENDWTNVDEPGLSIYEKSKLIAEQTAWQYVHETIDAPILTTIQPVAMLGPSLNDHVSGSFDLLTGLLDGTTKFIPDIPLNVVDVRDVADMHIKAMLNPQADYQRFIASADGQISLFEIAKLLKNKRPQISNKISNRKIPNGLIKLLALFNKRAKEGALMLDINRKVSNQKAKKVLNWYPRNENEDIVLISADCLAKNNLINK